MSMFAGYQELHSYFNQYDNPSFAQFLSNHGDNIAVWSSTSNIRDGPTLFSLWKNRFTQMWRQTRDSRVPRITFEAELWTNLYRQTNEIRTQSNVAAEQVHTSQDISSDQGPSTGLAESQIPGTSDPSALSDSYDIRVLSSSVGYVEIKPATSTSKYLLCKDLIRLGVLAKNSLDLNNLHGCLAIQVHGFKMTFFIITLMTDGIYLMVEVKTITIPASIHEIRQYLFDSDEIVSLLNCFDEWCVPLSQSQRSLKRESLSDEAFEHRVSQTPEPLTQLLGPYWPHLTKLCLNPCDTIPEHAFTSHLDIEYLNVGPTSLPSLPRLTDLYLDGNNSITSNDLRCLIQHSPHLVGVGIYHCERIVAEDFSVDTHNNWMIHLDKRNIESIRKSGINCR